MLTLREQAYSQILGQILGGELVPGDLLNRRGMAVRLGMSPAPVHEAMIHLERDGFLEALPRLGTRVRTASREDVRGHLVVREALECQVARLACGSRIREHLGELRPLARKADAVDFTDLERAQHEVAFHLAIAEQAGCPALLCEYRRVMQVGLFYRINLLMNLPSREPVSRHLGLLEELCSDSQETAEACARRHIWAGKPDSLKAGRL